MLLLIISDDVGAKVACGRGTEIITVGWVEILMIANCELFRARNQKNHKVTLNVLYSIRYGVDYRNC